MDAIQVMNGYNKSQAAFKRNNRALRIEVTGYDTDSDNWHSFKASWLKDTMGWHTVKLPARTYGEITVVFSGIRRGPDNDLALSELRFLSAGRPVDWKLPRAAMMTLGSEGGGADWKASRWDGRTLASDNVSEGSTYAYSPNGRYVTALENVDNKFNWLWVLDVYKGDVVRRRRMPSSCGQAIEWLDENTVGMALMNGEKLAPVLRLSGRQPRTRVPTYGGKD